MNARAVIRLMRSAKDTRKSIGENDLECVLIISLADISFDSSVKPSIKFLFAILSAQTESFLCSFRDGFFS